MTYRTLPFMSALLRRKLDGGKDGNRLRESLFFLGQLSCGHFSQENGSQTRYICVLLPGDDVIWFRS